jgi:hypothetical protein
MVESENGNPREGATILRSPVFWTAFITAIVAALANAYVAFRNNNTLLDIETQKESADQALQGQRDAEEQLIEDRKAEFSRLLELSKLDPEPAKQKLKAFIEMGLVTDPRIQSKLIPLTQSNAASQASSVDYASVGWDSDWVDGGHNQDEMCNKGIMALRGTDTYKGKVLSRLSASEDSKKDFLGHVQYRYHCTYRVSSS